MTFPSPSRSASRIISSISSPVRSCKIILNANFSFSPLPFSLTLFFFSYPSSFLSFLILHALLELYFWTVSGRWNHKGDNLWSSATKTFPMTQLLYFFFYLFFLSVLFQNILCNIVLVIWFAVLYNYNFSFKTICLLVLFDCTIVFLFFCLPHHTEAATHVITCDLMFPPHTPLHLLIKRDLKKS